MLHRKSLAPLDLVPRFFFFTVYAKQAEAKQVEIMELYMIIESKTSLITLVSCILVGYLVLWLVGWLS